MKLKTFRLVLLIFCMVSIQAMTQPVTVSSLLYEMTDLRALASRPDPWFKQGQASSYDRKSHEGGEYWYANYDVGQYVRTESNDGRTEHVLADLAGPGSVSRFWSANPDLANNVHFYFDHEKDARLVVPLNELFTGKHPLFGPEFSYISGTGGNLYFPLPYWNSLKITIEDSKGSLRLYYEIGYRSYEQGTRVETFDPRQSVAWQPARIVTGLALSHPQKINPGPDAKWMVHRLTVPDGGTYGLPAISGEKAVFSFSVRVEQTEESDGWDAPGRVHAALRNLLLTVNFDGEDCIYTPLGDFFGSGPGINPYENLLFSVSQDGWMTSRLVMPFEQSMQVSLFNAGSKPYTVEMIIGTCPYDFNENSYHLCAQWGSLIRESWPPFDINFLDARGEGKVIGTVYQVTNPSYIWWGEGDQKIFIDGESFPSSFGTGTEDDYGFAYGFNGPFARPYHAQTRVDGPASGGHISLNRWYVLDALPYRTSVRFDQEVWHWMPCTGYWSHVIYWYARPGGTGPRAINTRALMPMDLGRRENMLELLEGEKLPFEASGGGASSQRLANCSEARHLVWQNGVPGDSLRIRFQVPEAGQYKMMLNLCLSPDYGKYRFRVNERGCDQVIDAWSASLFWARPVLGVFDLNRGDNILEVLLLEPNPQAKPGNLFGLDYIFLERKNR